VYELIFIRTSHRSPVTSATSVKQLLNFEPQLLASTCAFSAQFADSVSRNVVPYYQRGLHWQFYFSSASTTMGAQKQHSSHITRHTWPTPSTVRDGL